MPWMRRMTRRSSKRRRSSRKRLLRVKVRSLSGRVRFAL